MPTNTSPWLKLLQLMVKEHPHVEAHLPGGMVAGKLHQDEKVDDLWYIESSIQGGQRFRHYFTPEQMVRISVKKAAPTVEPRA